MKITAFLIVALTCLRVSAADSDALKKAKEQLGKSVEAAIRYNQQEEALRKIREEKEAAIKAVTPSGLDKWSQGDLEMSVRHESYVKVGPVGSETMKTGEAFYAARCALCHGPDMIIPIVTQGMTGPVAVRGRVYNAFCPGQPDIGGHALAALASYITNSFGNKGYEVSVGQVEEIKAKHKVRAILSWTPAELKSVGIGAQPDPMSIKRGASVYARSCQTCHKPNEYSTSLLPFERKIPQPEWVAAHGSLAVKTDFSDQDNADVINYIISTLKISVGSITPQEVSLAKKKSIDFKAKGGDSGAKSGK
jgi:mono/diheme cytochrome c family protein